jgi:hypothetical protein
MQFTQRTLLLAALLMASASRFHAQSPAGPSGHWEGTIQMPDRELTFDLDMVNNNQGEIGGTIHVSGGNGPGFPVKVAVRDRSIDFHARVDQPFSGVFSADGKSISGDYSLAGFPIPFSMSRTGDAGIQAPEKSAPIGKELEGTWDGTLDVDGARLRFVLAMRNQSDGTSAGTLVSVDEGGLEVPVTITPQGSAGVALDFRAVGASYTGTWNRERRELAGTYRQGAFTASLTFRPAAAGN